MAVKTWFRATVMAGLAVYVIGTSGVRPVFAESMLTRDELQSLIVERSEAWGASAQRVLGIARCETGGKWRTDLIGSSGELGVGQWLARGAWYETKHFKQDHIDVRALYQSGHPDAYWWDVDGLAWAFSPHAPSVFWQQWSCRA